MEEQIRVEQYKQAHLERARSARQQWQIIGLGNPVISGVLVAALTATSDITSIALAALAIPIGFFLLVAYRKEIYFENLSGENIEAIEAECNVKHVQYDTFPQKPDAAHYLTRKPKPYRIESVSLHTLMTVLLLLFNMLAVFAFVYFSQKHLSMLASLAIALGFYPAITSFWFFSNRSSRVNQSFQQ